MTYMESGLTRFAAASWLFPASAYASYLEAIEPYPFDVMIYDGEDETVKAALASFIKRLLVSFAATPAAPGYRA